MGTFSKSDEEETSLTPEWVLDVCPTVSVMLPVSVVNWLEVCRSVEIQSGVRGVALHSIGRFCNNFVNWTLKGCLFGVRGWFELDRNTKVVPVDGEWEVIDSSNDRDMEGRIIKYYVSTHREVFLDLLQSFWECGLDSDSVRELLKSDVDFLEKNSAVFPVLLEMIEMGYRRKDLTK